MLQQQQQQQETEMLISKTVDAEANRVQQVSVTLESDRVEGKNQQNPKSPPPPPPPPPPRDEKPRHISFLDEKSNEKKRDYVPPDPPKPRGKSARWTLAVLPGRGSGAGKPGRTRLLNTIIQASSSSSAIDSLEHSEPPPPPPPLPPTPPFWQSKVTQLHPPLRPPVPPRPQAPHFPGLNIRARKKLPRRALTMRPEDSPSSIPETDVPYRPVQHFRSMIKQPWHRSGDVCREAPTPPAAKYGRQMTGPAAGRRFSRQNTIQVVSDVQGVLSDILRDIVPAQKPAGRPAKPMTDPKVQLPLSMDYGE